MVFRTVQNGVKQIILHGPSSSADEAAGLWCWLLRPDSALVNYHPSETLELLASLTHHKPCFVQLVKAHLFK